MTDGERLVWAASYAAVFTRGSDAVTAAREATLAVTQLRTAATRRSDDGRFLIREFDERDFVDEMVHAP